jgi:bla regulator protein BlaR1
VYNSRMVRERMTNRPGFVMKLLLVTIGATILVGPATFSINPPLLHAQSTDTDWEKAAGGKMSFDVASVKQNMAIFSSETLHEGVPLSASEEFVPTGGLFAAKNIPLIWYVRFAYKLTTTQFGEVADQLPKWALTNRYDIEARTTGNPNKNQFRLMMQSLLAERFKLAVHYELKQMSVFALVLAKSGKLGPNLRRHSADVPCPTTLAPESGPVETVTGGFPGPCRALKQLPSAEGRFTFGARDVPMSMIADTFSLGVFSTTKPVVDKTGLTGNYDFVIEFSHGLIGVQADPNAPIFLEALKDQLGLTLESTKGPVDVLVIDHVEEPSEN